MKCAPISCGSTVPLASSTSSIVILTSPQPVRFVEMGRTFGHEDGIEDRARRDRPLPLMLLPVTGGSSLAFPDLSFLMAQRRGECCGRRDALPAVAEHGTADQGSVRPARSCLRRSGSCDGAQKWVSLPCSRRLRRRNPAVLSLDRSWRSIPWIGLHCVSESPRMTAKSVTLALWLLTSPSTKQEACVGSLIEKLIENQRLEAGAPGLSGVCSSSCQKSRQVQWRRYSTSALAIHSA